MKDEDKTEEQVINELAGMRQKTGELEASEAERERIEERLQRAHDELERRVEERTARLKREIREHKLAKEARRESELRYRALFQESRDAVYMTTREGKVIDMNPSTLDLFGYTRAELMRINIRKVYAHPEDRQGFQEVIEREGSVRDYEVKFRKKDGTELDCLFTASLRRASDGTILGYQGITRDITDRKRAEEAVRESEKRLRYLSSQLLSAQESERKRIAAELHDSIGQTLAALKFRMENARRGLGLASMRERTEFSGGVFSVGSIRAKGTVVRASWPMASIA